MKTLQDAIEILIRIENPPEGKETFHLNPAMKVMMKPLRKRFKFHFLGTKATNNPAKPEWFVTQLTTWALAHR